MSGPTKRAKRRIPPQRRQNTRFIKKQHWWLQSVVRGWVPIDPGTRGEDEATTGEDE
jgi:hypothetical protein